MRILPLILILLLIVSCNQKELDKLNAQNVLLRDSLSTSDDKIKTQEKELDSLRNHQAIKLSQILKKETYTSADTALITEYEKVIHNYPKTPISEIALRRVYLIEKDKAIQSAKRQFYGRWKLSRIWSAWESLNVDQKALENEVVELTKDGICKWYKDGTFVKEEKFHFHVDDHCNDKYQVQIVLETSDQKGYINYRNNTLGLVSIGIMDGGGRVYSWGPLI